MTYAHARRELERILTARFGAHPLMPNAVDDIFVAGLAPTTPENAQVDGALNARLYSIDPSMTIRYALHNLAEGSGERYEASLLALDYLASSGVLRDPGEPTLAEVREKVEALGWVPSPIIKDGQRLQLVYRYEVLALLEPRDPEPHFKPGDWVCALNEPTPHAALVTRMPVGLGILSLSFPQGCYERFGGIDEYRFATPEEIARARGEA